MTALVEDPADIGQASRLRAEAQAEEAEALVEALAVVERSIRESRGIALRALVGRLANVYALGLMRLSKAERAAMKATLKRARGLAEAEA